MPSFWEQQWHQFIFMLANNGAMVFLGTLAIGVFGLGPIGRALAARLRGSATPALPDSDPSAAALKATLDEVIERLDFSERVLSELNSRSIGVAPAQIQHRTSREITPV
jgi:phosphoglycerate dehydrogenase-like enzyme